MTEAPVDVYTTEALNRTARGSEGARRIGARAVDPAFSGAEVQALLEELQRITPRQAMQINGTWEELERAGGLQARVKVSVWKFVNEIPKAERDLNPSKPYLWDWTPAMKAAVSYVRDNAGQSTAMPLLGPDRRFTTGHHTLYFPAWRYRCSGPRVLDYRNAAGWSVEGDGHGASTIAYEGSGSAVDVHRAARWRISDLTFQNADPGAPAGNPVKGLVEGSTCIDAYESSTDYKDGDPNTPDTPQYGNTLWGVTENVEIREFHFGVRLRGNQQLDAFHHYAPLMIDNFYDFFFDNSQAVNHQVYGGDIQGWALYYNNFQFYAERLAAWSAPKHPYDGAHFYVRAGGGVSVFGGAFETKKATVVVDEPGFDAALNATITNTLAVNFYGTRWEIRAHDTGGASWGGYVIQRNSVVRPVNPFPTGPAGTHKSQMRILFRDCDFNLVNTPDYLNGAATTLFYVWNSVQIRVLNTKILNPELGRVRGLVNDATAGASGLYWGEGTTLLAYQRLLHGAATLSGPFLNQRVYMREDPQAQAIPPDRARQFHTNPHGWGLPMRSAHFGEITGKLPGTGGAPAVLEMFLGGGAKLFTLAASRMHTGTTDTLNFDCTYADVFGNTKTRRLTLAQSSNQSAARLAFEEVLSEAADGKVTLAAQQTIATAVYGAIRAEWA